MNGKRVALSLYRLTVAAAVLSVSLSVLAAGDEHREHGKHEHGHGSLDVVLEGDELVITLRIPAVNVVGFEHDPSTDEQRQAVEEALAVFQKGSELFAPSEAAGCAVEKVEVALAGIEHHEGEEHEQHAGQDQEKHHQRENEGGHAEEHDEDVHAELHGEYEFHCKVPEKLKRLSVSVFEHLSEAEELEARIVTPTVQTAVELTPRNTVLTLAR